MLSIAVFLQGNLDSPALSPKPAMTAVYAGAHAKTVGGARIVV
jgi:hypothetical protein